MVLMQNFNKMDIVGMERGNVSLIPSHPWWHGYEARICMLNTQSSATAWVWNAEMLARYPDMHVCMGMERRNTSAIPRQL